MCRGFVRLTLCWAVIGGGVLGASAEAHPLTRFPGPLASMVALNLAPDLEPLRLPDADWWREAEDRRSRPRALAPLYLSFIALQVMDADSTAEAIRAGHAEANPFMARTGGSTGAMLAVKAVSTAGTIYAVEKLWKRNRVAAVIVMAAINVGYAAVVSSNYAKARDGR